MNEKEIQLKQKPNPNSTLPDSRKVLEQYNKAKKLVREIQQKFKTEYQSSYVDWYLPKSEIKKMQCEDIPDITNLKKGFESLVQESKECKGAGISSNQELPTQHSIEKRKPEPKAKGTEQKGIHQSNIYAENIFENLTKNKAKTAEFCTEEEKEKKAPLVEKHKVDGISTTTFELANNLLERAASRASSRKL
jgi:hypothetical protein